MKRLILSSLALVFPTTALATDLDLRAESGGNTTITVVPGEVVDYEIVGELTDNLNEGLAFFRFDLSFDGGALEQADDPTAAPMTAFDRPAGVTNPAGFGGTEIGGDLVQVGGLMNTINNFFAPYPNGSVITGVAKPGFAEVLVRGSLTAPDQVGTYTLSISEIDANVVRQGETGFPFWAVEQAQAGTVTNLTVVVSALSSPRTTVSISSPLPVTLDLHGGTPWGNRFYWLIGTAAGTTPGIALGGGLILPINPDPYTGFTITNPNTSVLSNNVGNLSPIGQSTAVFNLPLGINPHLVGAQISHAYVTLAQDFVSEAVTVTLVP
jgi:hypothetical protein